MNIKPHHTDLLPYLRKFWHRFLEDLYFSCSALPNVEIKMFSDSRSFLSQHSLYHCPSSTFSKTWQKHRRNLQRGKTNPHLRLRKLPPSTAMNKIRIRPDSCFWNILKNSSSCSEGHRSAELRPQEIRQGTEKRLSTLFYANFFKEANYWRSLGGTVLSWYLATSPKTASFKLYRPGGEGG